MESQAPTLRPWPHVFASLCLALLSVVLSVLYSRLHWKSLFVGGSLPECMPSTALTAAIRVLDSLWLVKIVAGGLAVGFAVWGLVRTRPAWPNIAALVIAACALLRAGMVE